jgi:hypothetical protein
MIENGSHRISKSKIPSLKRTAHLESIQEESHESGDGDQNLHNVRPFINLQSAEADEVKQFVSGAIDNSNGSTTNDQSQSLLLSKWLKELAKQNCHYQVENVNLRKTIAMLSRDLDEKKNECRKLKRQVSQSRNL